MSTIYYLLVYVYYLSTMYLIMEWAFKMSKLPLPPTPTRGLLLCVSLFCMHPMLCCCYVLCVVFFCFHLLGLKMTEVKHWGVKLGLKLSVVGLLLLFRWNQRGRCVEVIVSVCMLILIHFCIVRYLLQVMVYHKELRKNFSSGTVDGHTLLITIAQS